MVDRGDCHLSLRHVFATFCSPFQDAATSSTGAPLPPYACVKKSYTSAIGAALGYINTVFAVLMATTPIFVGWQLSSGSSSFPFYLAPAEGQPLKMEQEMGYMPPMATNSDVSGAY